MEAIIASVLGGLVSGLFTFLGVWLTIRHENKKARQEELKRQEEKEEQLFENRPRLEIMGYKKLTKYSLQKRADASIILCSIKEYKNVAVPIRILRRFLFSEVSRGQSQNFLLLPP